MTAALTVRGVEWAFLITVLIFAIIMAMRR